ncbi:hypothetical protein TorRG33x02_029960 [Trema orientale]|uniref:Uncharacterized protein n=1 Tax=Trema orientale TaxID=63057 RepID=A0A2P5FTW9_TREOI|nr:hypothetical protein TorRG33x02_029960 [Trema orientale]
MQVISPEGRKVSLYGPWHKHGSKTEHCFAKIDEGDKPTIEGITHPVSVKEPVTGGCSVAASVDLTIPGNETTAAVRRRSVTTVLNRVNREDHDTVSTPETRIPHVGKVKELAKLFKGTLFPKSQLGPSSSKLRRKSIKDMGHKQSPQPIKTQAPLYHDNGHDGIKVATKRKKANLENEGLEFRPLKFTSLKVSSTNITSER